MKRTQNRWGVPVAVQMATIYQESKFIGNARTPHQFALGVIPMGRQSSAYGYGQALDGTWDEYKREQGGWGRRRDDIADATDFMGWYFTKSREDLGIPAWRRPQPVPCLSRRPHRLSPGQLPQQRLASAGLKRGRRPRRHVRHCNSDLAG